MECVVPGNLSKRYMCTGQFRGFRPADFGCRVDACKPCSQLARCQVRRIQVVGSGLGRTIGALAELGPTRSTKTRKDQREDDAVEANSEPLPDVRPLPNRFLTSEKQDDESQRIRDVCSEPAAAPHVNGQQARAQSMTSWAAMPTTAKLTALAWVVRSISMLAVTRPNQPTESLTLNTTSQIAARTAAPAAASLCTPG
jgi:hypothetical protein